MPALVPKLRFPEFRDASGWEQTEVGEVFQVTRGDVLSMTLVRDEKSEAMPYPVYSSQTKNNGLSGFYSDYLFADAITWTTDGANAGDVNFRSGKFLCTNVCGVLLSSKGFANPSIAALINSVARKYVSYVGNPKLMNGVMSKIPIPLPPLAEQQKIAECLNSVDELMAAQARKVDALKTHKKGLMQQLFPREGETQPRLRFPEFQNAGEWKVGLIGDLATTVMGNAFRSTDFVESGTQVVRIGNLYQGELQLERAPVYLSDAQAEENAKFRVQPLDLLMSMTGTVGKRDYGFVIQVPPGCKPLLLNQRVMKLAPTVKCDAGFLLQLLKSDRLLDAIYSVPGGTKQANLSAQHIKDLEISYPPKSEQQRIATCLSSLDALITAEIQKHEALKTHKKGLMQQLFPSPEAAEQVPF